MGVSYLLLLDHLEGGPMWILRLYPSLLVLESDAFRFNFIVSGISFLVYRFSLLVSRSGRFLRLVYKYRQR